MADTVIIAKNGSAVLAKIFQRLARGSNMSTDVNKKSNLGSHIMRMKRRVWWAASADPSVDSGSQAAYPVKIGDLAYRDDSDEAFVCSVAPAASTAATFIQMHA